jgi:UDP-N-acetylglucosamine 2-epimerase (non-hydrolysing)
MSKLKVVTLVGTRPEVVKLSRVIAELEKQTTHILVHTGQNFDYELNEIFFQELGLKAPDHFLKVAAPRTAETIGNVISRSDEIFEREKPDAALFYGDTNSCLAVISAKRRQIPVFHMEAGNRCFDERVPEEINRRIVDHLSDINMTHTEHARRYLLAEGIRPETVIKTGSPMKEVLDYYRPRIEESDVLSRLGLEPGRYFLVSAHREENVDSDEKLSALLDSLSALRDQFGLRIVISTHPRTRQRLAALTQAGNRQLPPGLDFLKPFGFFDYVKLETAAFCVLSDSGTLTEESSLLGFPAVMIREAHERPEGMDAGVLVMTGLGRERVLQGVEMVTSQGRAPRSVPDYQTDDVSSKVVRIILSYVDSVNRTVWFRHL